jgi:hypothetical protein
MLIRAFLFLGLMGLAVFALNSRNGVAQTLTPANASESWSISGALSESCTCTVPCTCNFGQGPSPHHYCYAFYSYDIRLGKYGSVVLDGLHFGAADLKAGRTFFIDERATTAQREALKIIAARVIEKATATEAAATVRDITPEIRYVAITQEYGDWNNHLLIPGVGEFHADYLMGLDKTRPVTVHNNTTWRLADVIKAKTTMFRVRVGRDAINTRDTNSNQGEFSYTDKTDFGSRGAWSCGADMSARHHAERSDPMCGTPER